MTTATCRSNGLFSRTKSSSEAGDRVRWKLYEEYHPYGTTAFRASSGASGFAPKRYRYTGKERDDETGLYYYGARYYPPWLGRWTAVDPASTTLNNYCFVRANPIRLRDPNGLWDEDSWADQFTYQGAEVAKPGSGADAVAARAHAQGLGALGAVNLLACIEAPGLCRLGFFTGALSQAKNEEEVGKAAATTMAVEGGGWLLGKLAGALGRLTTKAPSAPTPVVPPGGVAKGPTPAAKPGTTPGGPTPVVKPGTIPGGPTPVVKPGTTPGGPTPLKPDADTLRAEADTLPPPAPPRIDVTATAESYRAVDVANPKLYAAGYFREGELELAIRAKLDDGTRGAIHGAEQFEAIVKHFGIKNIRTIKGSWSYGSNLKAFNEGIAAGLTPEQAAAKTWTGGQAAAIGFTDVKIKSFEKDAAGVYIKVEVLFSRK